MNESRDPKVIDLGGDELTRRTVIYHENSGKNLLRFFEKLRDGFFWAMLEKQLGECDRIMAEHEWRRTADRPGNFPDDYEATPYSDLWYAGKIGSLCWMVLESRSGDGKLAEVNLARIMEIGIRATEWQWRGSYKPSILTGRKQCEVLAEHRDKAHRKLQQKLTARRAAIARMCAETTLLGGALERHLQRRLKSEALKSEVKMATSLRTIRRDLKELRGP